MYIKRLLKFGVSLNCSCLFILIFLLYGCSQKIVQSLQPQSTVTNLASTLKIVSLNPLLQFERINDESILNPENYSGNEIEAKMIQISTNMLVKKNFKIVKPEELENREFDELFSRLQKMSSKLSVGYLSPEAKEILKKLSSFDENLVILSQYLYVKVGEGGTWNSYTGAITSSNSSSLLKVSLVHCNEEVIWKNQVLLREIPGPDNEKFLESLDILYSLLPKSKEE